MTRPAPDESQPADLIYESNPKHSDPWQPGRRGNICDQDVRPHAQSLLINSLRYHRKRYAAFAGKAYCAQEHLANRWHGYPVGWREVPQEVRKQLQEDGVVTRRDIKKYFEAHG